MDEFPTIKYIMPLIVFSCQHCHEMSTLISNTQHFTIFHTCTSIYTSTHTRSHSCPQKMCTPRVHLLSYTVGSWIRQLRPRCMVELSGNKTDNSKNIVSSVTPQAFLPPPPSTKISAGAHD